MTEPRAHTDGGPHAPPTPSHGKPADAGDLVLRTVPQPADINVNGNIFGGWVLSQMDIAGGVVAGRIAGGPVATVAIESMSFLRPIEVGDIVSVYVREERRGTTSVRLNTCVYAERAANQSVELVTSGTFIFVALGAGGKPRPLNAPDQH